MKTKAGSVYLVASDLGLRGVYWNKQTVPFATSLKVDCPAVQILAQSVGQLDEYFAGKRMEFDLPLDVQGTEFQKSVWKALTKIPYGKTASYRDIAKKVKNENASRAVGTANGKNPLCIIVPCHRVIASNGTLGGYSGGLHLKTQLLALENSSA